MSIKEGIVPKLWIFYLRALKLFEKLKDKPGEAMMLNRIGTVYSNQDNAEKGLEYYLKSLDIYKTLKDHKEMSNPLNAIGLYYEHIGNHVKALAYF